MLAVSTADSVVSVATGRSTAVAADHTAADLSPVTTDRDQESTSSAEDAGNERQEVTNNGGNTARIQQVHVQGNKTSWESTYVEDTGLTVAETEHQTEVISHTPCPLPPEVHQLRTVMETFKQRHRLGFERIAGQNPRIGIALVEILQAYTDFRHSILVCRGQGANLNAVAEAIHSDLAELAQCGMALGANALSFDNIDQHTSRIVQNISILMNLSKSYSDPGWLFRLIIDAHFTEKIVHLFGSVHDTLCAMLQRQIPRPELKLKNTSKTVIQELKDIAHGPWSDGLSELQCQPEARERLGALLGATATHILQESFLNLSLPWGLQEVSTSDHREGECRAVFHEYTMASNEGITQDSFEHVMRDLAIIDGLNADECGTQSRRVFVSIDSDFDARLSYDEFASFYLSRKPFPTSARSLQRMVCGVGIEKSMVKVFQSYAVFGASRSTESVSERMLDSSRFVKLCRDAKILQNGLDSHRLDVIFSKCTTLDSRKMCFDNLLIALSHISVCIGEPLHEISRKIAACGEPSKSSPTKTQYVKLHDDKSLFTGVYKRGGPHIGPLTIDLKQFVDRSRPSERNSPERPITARRGSEAPPTLSSSAITTCKSLCTQLDIQVNISGMSTTDV